MADYKREWPLPYPKEKIGNLSKILGLLKEIDKFSLDKPQVSSLTKVDEENSPIIEDGMVMEYDVTDEEQEPESKRTKLEDAPKVLKFMTVEELTSELCSNVAETADLNSVLANIEYSLTDKSDDFLRNLVSPLSSYNFSKIVLCAINSLIIEDRHFLLYLRILDLLLKEPSSNVAADDMASLIKSYPQRKAVILSFMFNLDQGEDILDSILDIDLLSKEDLREGLLYSLQNSNLASNNLKILEKLTECLYPESFQDNELLIAMFQCLVENPDSSKCLKSAKFTTSILNRVSGLNEAASSCIQTFVLSNKTFLRRKMEQLLNNQ